MQFSGTKPWMSSQAYQRIKTGLNIVQINIFTNYLYNIFGQNRNISWNGESLPLVTKAFFCYGWSSNEDTPTPLAQVVQPCPLTP